MRWPGLKRILPLVVIALLIYGAFNLVRPLPAIQPTPVLAAPAASQAPVLDWPTFGQAALATTGLGVVGSSGKQKPVPVGSVAKVITALTVLEAKPLADKQSGPTLTMGKQDVAFYKSQIAKGGSVTLVRKGQKFSQRQALQLLLIPSSNNMAESLAQWAFGSQKAYVSAANKYAANLGLKDTHIADASGLLPKTKSTASDLVKLGELATADPVLAKIVVEDKVNVKGSGTVESTNSLLGTDGVNGIKTGHTDESGGCLLFSAEKEIAGQTVRIYGAVLGGSDLAQALDASERLVASGWGSYETVTVAAKGQVVGRYTAPWGASVDAVATKKHAAPNWKGQQLAVTNSLNAIETDTPAGELVGTVGAGDHTSQAQLQTKIVGPSLAWRLFR